MKDSVLTIRLPRATRERIERLAKAEGRSLSSQVERLLDAALNNGGAAEPRVRYEVKARKPRSLAGVLAGGRVPGMNAFRSVRRELGASLSRRHEDDRD